MGNCQAVDAAALVIQHPSGRIDRMYWPISASEVMKMNPGHYVSLIIPLPVSGEEENTEEKTVRFTRVKLLRPSDTLVLGRAYRLVTTQDVMKVLRAKKYAKMKKNLSESAKKSETDQEKQSSNGEAGGGKYELEKTSQVKISSASKLLPSGNFLHPLYTNKSPYDMLKWLSGNRFLLTTEMEIDKKGNMFIPNTV